MQQFKNNYEKKRKNEKKASSKNRCCKRWFREIVAKSTLALAGVSKKFTSQTLKTDYEYSFYLKTFHEMFAMKAFIPKMLLVSSFG